MVYQMEQPGIGCDRSFVRILPQAQLNRIKVNANKEVRLPRRAGSRKLARVEAYHVVHVQAKPLISSLAEYCVNLLEAAQMDPWDPPSAQINTAVASEEERDI